MQARTFKKSFWCHVNHLHLLMVDIKGIVWVKYFFKHHRRLLVVGLNTQVLNTKLIHAIKSLKKKRPLKEKDYSLYSPLNGIPLLGAILNVALSSYDIINWVKCLKMVSSHLATKQTRHQRTRHQGTISPPTYSPPSEVFSPPTTNKEISRGQ